ncbi:ubiquitin-conjugating enzyme E2 22-like [Rutidosis leptorrhynchoides]|uniref:ubiquitin-conjugating enzyme E2 22-like n=1 Tax=Rutidosis leptorrhynchoides TaxID=125765 RepID=UPI003A99E564
MVLISSVILLSVQVLYRHLYDEFSLVYFSFATGDNTIVAFSRSLINLCSVLGGVCYLKSSEACKLKRHSLKDALIFFRMATNENLPPNVIKQLAKELKSLDESPPEGIKVVVNDDDFSTIFADIEGPAGTPYENGVFRMKLRLSHDFPHSPPKGYFLAKIFHPNIATNGEICVNTLKKDWNPTLGLRHVLIVVRCLLIEPFPESALNEQAGKMLLENYDEYARHARLYTSIHAKPKPKFKSGAITESTTALNVDQSNASILNVDQKSAPSAAAAALPLPSPLAPTVPTTAAVLPHKKEGGGIARVQAADKKKLDARKKSLKRL